VYVGAASAAIRDRDAPPVYTNTWAVEVEGGKTEAEALAAKFGFNYIGQVSLGILPRAPTPTACKAILRN
jgi:hypothetical protein